MADMSGLFQTSLLLSRKAAKLSAANWDRTGFILPLKLPAERFPTSAVIALVKVDRQAYRKRAARVNATKRKAAHAAGSPIELQSAQDAENAPFGRKESVVVYTL